MLVETVVEKSNGSIVTLNRLALLRFFDEVLAESRRHATAVCAVMGEELGIALLCDYLKRREGFEVTVRTPCNQGTQRGHRLDAWVKAISPTQTLLFQVEVKNWSAHAIGGRKLAVNASEQESIKFRKERFERYFDVSQRRIHERDSNLGKVLEPMKTKDQTPVSPLACMWYSLHPEGKPAPFFCARLALVSTSVSCTSSPCLPISVH